MYIRCNDRCQDQLIEEPHLIIWTINSQLKYIKYNSPRKFPLTITHLTSRPSLPQNFDETKLRCQAFLLSIKVYDESETHSVLQKGIFLHFRGSCLKEISLKGSPQTPVSSLYSHMPAKPFTVIASQYFCSCYPHSIIAVRLLSIIRIVVSRWSFFSKS